MLTLGEMIRLNGARVPNHVALVWHGHDVRVTYAELDRRTNALANSFISMGIKKGDRIALFAANSTQFIETHVSSSKIGAILVPFNTMVTAMELGRLLNHSEAKAIVISADFAAAITSIKGGIPHVQRFISIGHAEGFEDFEDLVAGRPESNPGIAVSESDIAYITYTSGTTGLPKGVMLSYRNLFSNCVNAAIGYRMRLGSIELVPFPLFFSAVFTGHVISHMFVQGTLVFLDWFHPDSFIDAINRERPNLTMVNPTMMNDFINHPRFKACDLSSLSLFLVGAAPIAPARFQEARKAIGNILIQPYGLTEASAFVTTSLPEDYNVSDQALLERRLTSVGRVGPTLEMKIVDDAGEDLPNDGYRVGELLVKGPSVMQGYWKQPEATRAAIKDGWLHTGDLGAIDPDGYLWIVGRKKDVIKSGGINVYPEEVEDVLYRMTWCVQEAAVVGRPDDRWGEAVTAVIVPKPGAAVKEDEVIRYCRENLAGYKKPTRVISVDRIPRNASGKIKKNELRDMLVRGQLK